jgi:hypothetical protein
MGDQIEISANTHTHNKQYSVTLRGVGHWLRWKILPATQNWTSEDDCSAVHKDDPPCSVAIRRAVIVHRTVFGPYGREMPCREDRNHAENTSCPDTGTGQNPALGGLPVLPAVGLSDEPWLWPVFGHGQQHLCCVSNATIQIPPTFSGTECQNSIITNLSGAHMFSWS